MLFYVSSVQAQRTLIFQIREERRGQINAIVEPEPADPETFTLKIKLSNGRAVTRRFLPSDPFSVSCRCIIYRQYPLFSDVLGDVT